MRDLIDLGVELLRAILKKIFVDEEDSGNDHQNQKPSE